MNVLLYVVIQVVYLKLSESVVYFNPENIEEMSHKISETLMSDDKIKILKIKGKERVKNFTWFNCAKQINYIVI